VGSGTDRTCVQHECVQSLFVVVALVQADIPRTVDGSCHSCGMSCCQVSCAHNSGKHRLLALSHRTSLFSVDTLDPVSLCSPSLGEDIDSIIAFVEVTGQFPTTDRSSKLLLTLGHNEDVQALGGQVDNRSTTT